MTSRACSSRFLRGAALFVASLAICATSAQVPRIAFTILTSADLEIGDPVGQVVADFNQDGHLDLLSSTKLFTSDGTGFLSFAAGSFFGSAE